MTERRAIRSYVIRQGRMTPGQRRALDEHWPRYGLDVDEGPVDVDAAFEQQAPLTIEIGFGMGDSLFEMASTRPERNFIGVEVHAPGVGHLLIRAAEAGLDNLRVFNADGIDVIERAIPDGCADTIQVFFPDPWHKKRHHKRRLLGRDFMELLVAKLKPGGCLHVATDWLPYAEEIRETAASIPGIEHLAPPPRPRTKYEQRGIRLGHEVTDLAWKRS